MRSVENVFHLAIPCEDLRITAEFYGSLPHCKIARQYDDRVTVNFFGDQIVCHLTKPEEIVREPKLYPRHFGITFRESAPFDDVHSYAKEHGLPFFMELFVRFEGMKEEHRTFLIRDPSNNLIEFKHYISPSMMY